MSVCVKPVRPILLLLLLTVCIDLLHAQYVFRHYDIVDGLSDNQIRDITLAPDGRIVIRTMTMLNIFNGATFDVKGRLWIDKVELQGKFRHH